MRLHQSAPDMKIIVVLMILPSLQLGSAQYLTVNTLSLWKSTASFGVPFTPSAQHAKGA